LGEVTVKSKYKQQFRDKYMGSLDSLAKLEINSDFIGECGWLNCPLCKTGKNPVEGKTYNKWVGTGIPEVISGMPGIHPFRFYANEVVQIVYHYPKFTEEELLKINNLTREKGYYPEREFYQPNYDKTDSLSMIPDYRNTLLWAPSVLTDRNGEAQLEFYCSDIYTDFVGVIEGVSGDGKFGSEIFEFKVLKTKPFGWEK